MFGNGFTFWIWVSVWCRCCVSNVKIYPYLLAGFLDLSLQTQILVQKWCTSAINKMNKKTTRRLHLNDLIMYLNAFDLRFIILTSLSSLGILRNEFYHLSPQRMLLAKYLCDISEIGFCAHPVWGHYKTPEGT